jgi:rhodanese-related sulfurtransferase
VLLEGLFVGVMGAAFALVANAVSPYGLRLDRNYFPGASHPLRAPVASTNATGAAARTNVPSVSALEALSARLKAKGLQLVDSNEVVRLFRDPRYARGLVLFVDARDESHYQEGHVPGAYHFDHYRAENHLADVLPVCQIADQIVLYCNGGGCEDSEFAAITLSDAGIARTKLLVYGGGMTEWITNGLPVEIGPRHSGKIRNGSG